MSSKDVAVYGSGVSGLIAAYYLLKEGFHVDVIDPYVEPKIQSLKVSEGIVERAANSILYNKEVGELLRDINLDYEFYSDLGKKKYVFRNGKIKRWPLSFLETLKSGKVLFFLAKKKEDMKPLKGETVEEWGKRKLGTVVLENLMTPGLQGVYGGDTGSLSASLVVKNIFRNKRTKSRKMLEGSVSFKNGMQGFTNHLWEYLSKNEVNFYKESSKSYNLKVISTPAYSLPDFASEETKKLLGRVTYKKVSTLTIFVKKQDRLPFQGFGVVFKNQKEGVLGLILNSDLFEGRAKDGLVSETWIFDGEFIKEEALAVSLTKTFRKEKFDRKNTILNSYFKYWEKAFPSYDIILENILRDKLGKIEQAENLHFFANWTGDLGIGSMIRSGGGFARNIRVEFEQKEVLDA